MGIALFKNVQSRGRRILLTLLVIFFAVALLVSLALFLLLQGAKARPEFYKKALQADRAVMVQSSREVKEKTETTFKKLSTSDRKWNIEYTEEEINGFLAVDLKNMAPNTLPKEISEPRISLRSDKRIQLACMVEHSGLSGVLDLTLEVEFPKENQCRMRFCEAKLGIYNVSTETVRDLFADGFARDGSSVERITIENDPGLVTDFKFHLNEKLSILAESILIEAGKISLTGSVEKRK